MLSRCLQPYPATAAAVLLAVLIPCALLGCQQASEENPLPEQTQPVTQSAPPLQPSLPSISDSHKFLGSNACSECHPAIAAAWQQHPMANSFAAASSLPRNSENAPPVVPGIKRSYHISLEDGTLIHRDQMLDASGAEIYSQQFAMDFVVGSGRRAHAWLRQEGSLLFQSPINWYSEEARWDVAPGYKPDDPRRFRRRVTDDCISCHAGRPSLQQAPLDTTASHPAGRLPHRYDNPAFHETGIGCERCHGPGLDHVNWHRQKNSTNASQQTGSHDPIVNPAELAPQLRESVCNQCHLAGSARIVRFGRTEFDFRPGRDFDEFWTILHAGSEVAEDGTTKAVNHVQQMHESRCFQNSSGKLGCISCHDPHSVPAPSEAPAFYRRKCFNCHDAQSCSETPASREPLQDSCIACHMPNRGSGNIAHVTQTDHRVIRRNQPESPSAPSASTTIQLQFFGNARKTLPDWEQQRAMAAALWAVLAKKGLTAPPELGRFLENVLKTQPTDGLSLTTLAALEARYNRSAAAKTHYQQALNDPLSHEAALAALLDLAYRAALWDDAQRLARQLLVLDPGHPGCLAVLADCLWNLQRQNEALEVAQQSLDKDPSQIEVRRWLISSLRKVGRSAEAQAQEQILKRMESAGVHK